MLSLPRTALPVEFFKFAVSSRTLMQLHEYVVSGSMDLFKSSNHAYLIALQTTVPILVNFVLVRETTEGDHQMKSVIFYSTSWKLVRHPFKAVHLVPVTMLLLSIAC